MTPVWIVLHQRHSNLPPDAHSTHWTPSAAHVAAGKLAKTARPGEVITVIRADTGAEIYPGDIRRGPEDKA